MRPMDASLAKEAAKLYALPAGEFTAARNARAKKLRADDAELAAAVAKLAKPTVAAAAVNRLARDQPSEMRELIQAGKRLREAQERAVAGKGGPDDLQRALADHRTALDRLQREARRLRLSEPVLERVGRTIRAASIDPELQRELERGVIAQEIEAAGFGLDPGLVVPAAPKRPPRSAPGTRRSGRRPRSDSTQRSRPWPSWRRRHAAPRRSCGARRRPPPPSAGRSSGRRPRSSVPGRRSSARRRPARSRSRRNRSGARSRSDRLLRDAVAEHRVRLALGRRRLAPLRDRQPPAADAAAPRRAATSTGATASRWAAPVALACSARATRFAARARSGSSPTARRGGGEGSRARPRAPASAASTPRATASSSAASAGGSSSD